MLNEHQNRLNRILNGLTNYSYGIYYQIHNINCVIDLINIKGHHLSLDELKIISLLFELRSFLESIAKVGDIPPYK